MRVPSFRRKGAGARERKPRGKRRSLLLLTMIALLVLSPVGVASADPPINTNPNDACAPADHPSPEQYGSGIDGMVRPPDYPSEQLKKTPPEKLTPYDRYGSSGQFWYAVDMGCSDAMSMVGNSVANTTFTLVRAIDRTTITIYQAAASESLLGWLKKTVDGVIKGIGNTFGAKYWSWVVILGALWLAWWGLIRKRASRVAEGTIWMVVAMVGLIWLISRPGDFTTLGTKVSDGATAAFNAALPQSDNSGATCVPNNANAQQNVKYDAVTRNANGLWVTLVCKPWLMGEFGTDDAKSKIVQDNAARLLSSQAVDLNETYSGKKPDVGKKSDDFKAVSKNVKENHPGAYPVFQGKNWQSRLAVAFGALFAALVAGLLVLVISVMLMILKIAFLLLLVAGPIFLGIGIHPGIGRVIAIRWFELLLSTLLKQAALIGVLALLLWCYGLIMAESLPWGLQILLISLVTLAAFIYRKPFQHLFAAVGYSAVNSRKSEEELERSVKEVRKRTTAVATAAVPGASAYRFARWGKRDTGGLAGAPAGDDPRELDLAAVRDDSAKVAGAAVGGDRRGRAAQLAARAAGGPRGSAPPLQLSPRSQIPGSPPGGRTSGGGLSPARPSGAAPAARPTGNGAGGDSRPPSGGGARPPSPGNPSGATVVGGSGGRSVGRRDSGDDGGGGRGWFGGGRGDKGGNGSGGSSGAGRGWFGGSSGGGGPGSRRRDSDAAPGRTSRGGGARRSGRDESSAAGTRRPVPPPLWSGKSRDEGPPMPFWLRPVKRDDNDEQ